MTAEENQPLDFERGLTLLKESPTELSEVVALLTQLRPAQRATCPNCGAATVQVVNIEKKNLGAALLTEWLLDSTAAGIAAGSKTVICNACVACGFQWLPGSPQEALARLLSGQLGEDTYREWRIRMERRDQELQEERRTSRRQMGIVGASLAVLAIGVWIYQASFSPQARARAQELRRTDAWVKCVLEQHPGNTADCGEPVSQENLNTWFEDGHMELLRNVKVRERLRSLAHQ